MKSIIRKRRTAGATPRGMASELSRRPTLRSIGTLGSLILLVAALGACNQSIPPTTVTDPLALDGSTLTLTPTSGHLDGILDTRPHTSSDIDPGYVLFAPSSVTFTIPVSKASLTYGGTDPATLPLDNVSANVTLSDPSSAAPVTLAFQSPSSSWTLTQVSAGSSQYVPQGVLELSFTTSNAATIDELTGLLTSGGSNTTSITVHAGSTLPLQSGDSVQLTFGSGSVVFNY